MKNVTSNMLLKMHVPDMTEPKKNWKYNIKSLQSFKKWIISVKTSHTKTGVFIAIVFRYFCWNLL